MLSPHVVIVGAGPGGLAAAINLAGLGLRVTVVEKDEVPGGRMKGLTFGDAGEYRVDTGPTILQLPGVLGSIFARAGKSLADYIPITPLDVNTRVHFDDGTHLDTSRDMARMEASIAQFGPDKPARLRAWMRESREKYAIAYRAFIATPADSLGYYAPMRLAPTLRFRPWQSLYAQLMDHFDDERIAYALAYPSKYLGLHPTTCSSVFSVIPYLELAFGVHHPQGGFRALARAMMQCAQDCGTTFRMDAPVAQVWIENGHAKGVVLTSGERIEADAVIVNADLPYAAQKLVDPRWRRFTRLSDRALSHAAYSCSTFMLYLGLDRTWNDLPHHLIHLSAAAKRTDRDALEDRVLDTDDPPFYVCNPCVTDASGAPEGHSTLYVLVPTPNTSRAVDWTVARRELTAKVPGMLARVGLHDVARHIRAQRAFTAETWRDDFNVFRGAVFNLSHTWSQLGPLRPRVKSDDVDGLYWVGGGTHPGSGLLTIFESANIASDYIARARGQGALANWPYVPEEDSEGESGARPPSYVRRFRRRTWPSPDSGEGGLGQEGSGQ